MCNDPQRPPIGAGNVDDLQFDRVEAAAPAPQGLGEPIDPDLQTPPTPPPGVTACAACGEPISDVYFEAAGKVVCPSCRDAVMASQAKGAGFAGALRSVLFAAGAIVAGSVVAFVIQGRFFGLLAIGLGWTVGKAVHAGSGKRGGLGYRLLAILLTYVGVAAMLAAVVIAQWRQDDADLASPAAIFAVVITCLAGPVLLAIERPFTLFALLIAFWEAWQINRSSRLVFNGPYRLAPSQGGTSAPAVFAYGASPPPPIGRV